MLVSVWTCLASLAQIAVALAIGELTAIESANVRIRLVHFVVSKLFQTLYVVAAAKEGYHDFAVCASWWGLTGTLAVVGGVCQDRVTRLLQAQRLPVWKLLRIMVLLGIIFTIVLVQGVMWVTVWRSSVNLVFMFELFAIPTHLIKCGKQLTKYALHLALELQDGSAHAVDDDSDSPSGWSVWQGSINFYADLVCGLCDDTLRVVHHLWLLWTFGFRFRIVDIVILLDIRAKCRKLMDSINGYHLYCVTFDNIHHTFDDADADAIATCGGVCSICFSTLAGSPESCKRLPCGHIFHLNCLLGWVQQNHNLVANNFTCPVCRSPLYLQRSGHFEKGVLGAMFRICRWVQFQLGFQFDGDQDGVAAEAAAQAQVQINTGASPSTEALTPPSSDEAMHGATSPDSLTSSLPLEGRVPHRVHSETHSPAPSASGACTSQQPSSAAMDTQPSEEQQPTIQRRHARGRRAPAQHSQDPAAPDNRPTHTASGGVLHDAAHDEAHHATASRRARRGGRDARAAPRRPRRVDASDSDADDASSIGTSLSQPLSHAISSRLTSMMTTRRPRGSAATAAETQLSSEAAAAEDDADSGVPRRVTRRSTRR